MTNNWNNQDIERGIECICKLDLLLDDFAYFESRGIMYKSMKSKTKVIRDEYEKHIQNFYKIADEQTQQDLFKKIEELKLKIKI